MTEDLQQLRQRHDAMKDELTELRAKRKAHDQKVAVHRIVNERYKDLKDTQAFIDLCITNELYEEDEINAYYKRLPKTAKKSIWQSLIK